MALSPIRIRISESDFNRVRWNQRSLLIIPIGIIVHIGDVLILEEKNRHTGLWTGNAVVRTVKGIDMEIVDRFNAKEYIISLYSIN